MGDESLVVVLVWFDMSEVCSSMIVSELLSTSGEFSSSTESGGSVCLRLELCCLSLVRGSVDVGDVVSWEIG